MSKKRNRQKQRQKQQAAVSVASASTSPPTLRPRLLGWWRKPLPKWWVLGLGLLALAQFFYNFRPRLDILSAIPLDEHDPVASIFLIQNTGPWSLYDLRFRCDLYNGQGRFTLSNNVGVIRNETPLGQPPIEQLSPGGIATRDCLAGPQSHFIHIPVPDPAAVQIDMVASYRWPLIGRFRVSTTARHFSVRRSPDQQKLLLVPDIKSASH